MTAFPATDQTSVRGMDSEFDLASSSETQTLFTHTTSYTYSTSDEVNVNIGLNIPDIASLSASMKATATTTHDNTVEDKFGKYETVAFNIKTITGFDDVVWYDSKSFNLWIYRVLAHFACPASDPGCDTGQPLFLTFSGPDHIVPHPHSPGSTVEWYHPYHEVGNILSYPQDLAQLGDALGTDVDPVSELPFTTSSDDNTATLTWSQTQTDAQSSGSVTTHSHSETESVSGGTSFFGSEGGSFTESKSASLTTLNSLTQTMAASDGFSISVPGFNLGEEYSYPFDGYILGDPVDPDVLQQELLADLDSKVDQPVNGTLRLAFTAQPGAAAGLWWSNGTASYLSAPDVALNHPFRWSLLSETSGPLSADYCFNVLDRDNVQTGGGYEIKGLLVLADGATSGPQLTVANEGDTLQLQARVYNYSRLDMAKTSPAVAHVRVQFYGQEWDTTTQEFTGDAFLIDDVTIDPIAGNNGGELNSRLASTSFDTGSCPLAGGCGGKYLKFWLVVWMEDAAGDLVGDYQNHGLKQAPTTALTGIGQADIEPISNNVGYFDQEIYVCAAGAQCTLPPGGAAAARLSIDEVTVSADQASVHETVEVSARLRSGEQPVGPVLLFFHDGDPASGQAFEVEHVPFIEANASYLAKVRYQPRTRGVHDLVVVARAGERYVTAATQLEAVEPADPTCQNPLTLAARHSGSVTAVGAAGQGAAMRMSAVVPLEGPLDLGAATVTVDRLAHELGGAQELIKGEDGAGVLPLVLQARSTAGARHAVFETEPGARPALRLTLHRLRDDRLNVELRLRGAAIPALPQLCNGDPPRTSLMARISALDDGVNPPLVVPLEGSWECLTDSDGVVHRLRARDAAFAP
jgi:hypothetical protein